MADAEPTIRYAVTAGKPVLEVGGVWTVFSLRGFRAKADKARQAAGTAKAARVVDASAVKQLDTAGGPGNLGLAGGGAGSQGKTGPKGPADNFHVVKNNNFEAPPPPQGHQVCPLLREI